MISYGEYKKMGYSAVPREQFARFLDMAVKAVRKFTRGFGGGELGEGARRGLCEICEVYYAEHKSGGRLASFTNDGYREHYFQSDTSKRVFQLIQLYFPRGQVFRGV